MRARARARGRGLAVHDTHHSQLAQLDGPLGALARVRWRDHRHHAALAAAAVVRVVVGFHDPLHKDLGGARESLPLVHRRRAGRRRRHSLWRCRVRGAPPLAAGHAAGAGARRWRARVSARVALELARAARAARVNERRVRSDAVQQAAAAHQAAADVHNHSVRRVVVPAHAALRLVCASAVTGHAARRWRCTGARNK